MSKFFILPIVFCALLLSSCASNKVMYDWDYYSKQTNRYIKQGDEEDTEKLFEVYQKIIDGQENTIRQTVPPGICADYGWLLVKAGKVEEGKALLLKEKELYPESARFIDGVIKKIER